MTEYPNAKHWFADVETRPALPRARKALSVQPGTASSFDDCAREVMFGATQLQHR